MKKVIVTTSWDDGHLLDLRLAQLLQDAGLKGTFYISRATGSSFSVICSTRSR